MSCTIRPCTVKDCKVIMQLIKEIAIVYNVSPAGIKVNLEALQEDGFGARPQFDCYVAELPPGQKSKKGQQIGKRLIAKAAEVAVSQGCVQLHMHVASWKASEKSFLARRGGEDLTVKEGWTLFHFEDAALQRLAAESKF
ncbi:thialysine N-epsilon-acetyltransferase-like isoform X2 [Emydura macquarii macquarii]|uniref:thialysine N-epsilon-acetyltransferase-like isoform X2 n=1 Tax=Emydura macquarii macquarii TaxID=1129001 RepID=UPI00352B2EB1